VKVSNTSSAENYRDMVLTQIFASGWEIHNVRMDDFITVHQSSVPDYQDIRDDRVYTYFQLPRYESKIFVIIKYSTCKILFISFTVKQCIQSNKHQSPVNGLK
jgi:hypothetical protein